MKVFCSMALDHGRLETLADIEHPKGFPTRIAWNRKGQVSPHAKSAGKRRQKKNGNHKIEKLIYYLLLHSWTF